MCRHVDLAVELADAADEIVVELLRHHGDEQGERRGQQRDGDPLRHLSGFAHAAGRDRERDECRH